MKFRILLKSFDNELINLASQQLRLPLLTTESILNGVVSLPIKIKRFCVLRSPHIDKDSREHFELRLYKRFMDIETNSSQVLDLLLKTELPAGISCSLKVLETQN
jgi:small subunit ribosomal protein S10